MVSNDSSLVFIDLSSASCSKNGLWEIARLNRSCEKLVPGKIDRRSKLFFLLQYCDSHGGVREAIRKCESDLRIHRFFWS
jgi:hypothetical protein